LNPAVTTDARVVVETALERSRERRYPNALALAEDLRRIAEYEPIQARPAGPMLRLRRWVRREPAWAAALGVTLLALVTGLVASLVALSRISTNFNRAQARLFCGEVPAFQAQSPAGALALGLEAVEFEDTWATRSVLYPPLLDLTLAAQYEMPERPVRGAAFVGSEGLVAAAADGTVRLFDRANGAQVAEVDVGDDARSLAVGNGSVFVGTAAGRVVALDAADLRTLWSERVVAEMVHDLVVDERRGIVIALAGARTVVALDGASGTERSRHTAQEGSLGALRRAGESDRLVATGRAFHGLAATRGDSALLFSLPDLDVVARLECGAPTRDAAVSRGSGRVVVVDDSGAARLFRLDDGSPLPLEDGGPAAWSVGQTAFSVAIDAKGATIVVAAADEEERFVRAWHAHAGESVRVEPQWTVRVPERVVDLAVSPDDRTVAAACWDNRVHTLDLERGTTIAQHAERNRPLHVLWSPDGDGALVSFGIATTIEEWRTRPLVSAFRLDLRELDPPAPLVWGRFTSDGEKVVVIDDRGRACIHASPARSDPDGPEPGALLARVDPDRGAADAGARVVLAADAPVALWVAPDGRSRVFDVSTSAVRAEISLAAALGPSPLREEAVALAPDGTTAAIIDAAGEAWIWRPDAAPFRLVRSEVADETPRALRAVRFGVDGDVFVVDGLGRVFRAPARTAGDAVSFEPLPSTPGSAEGPVALAVAPGGRELAVVLEGDRLERWSLPSGQRLPPSSGRISRRWVRYIADGRVLTVARGAGAATVSDGSGIVAQSGPLRHDDEITSCAVGPRGEIFATGSLDGTVFIRDVATCAPTGRVAVHTGAVRWVDVCDGPAGVRVLSSGDDGAMVLPVDILGEAERRAPRGLFPYERRTLAALVGDR
ncbi:MAG: PQQ-binding-like beta-propeller repeat protein, partial [Planctomycetota bacterium]